MDQRFLALKTLIVEDNVTFREAFKEVLCKLFSSAIVEEAANGTQALQIIETFSPDLVFMDVRLPGETGLELTKKIKESHPHIAIVVLTDYDLPEYREAAFESGADDFVVKGSLNPPAIAALVKSISQP
jgi:DNA-binding NarL/FixJ family response regulator